MALYDYDPNTARRLFFSRLVMTVGALVTLLCGGCTLFWLVMAAAGAMQPRGESEYAGAIAFLALIVGGLPTASGIALIFLGRRASRRALADAASASNPPQTDTPPPLP
jgi:hypothetical protein